MTEQSAIVTWSNHLSIIDAHQIIIKQCSINIRDIKIRWEDGDYLFKEAMEDIREKVEDRVVYVKGMEKVIFLKSELWVVNDLEMIPSFKMLKSCASAWCEYKHGNNCARRKAHELKHYVDTNNIQLV